MKYKSFYAVGLVVLVLSSGAKINARHPSIHKLGHHKYVNTEAGRIDFRFTQANAYSGSTHSIAKLSMEHPAFELEDGSKWEVSKPDLLKGWDGGRLVITQNHAKFSLDKYAIANPDLQLAVPVSLVREPAPGAKNSYYVVDVDMEKDVILLNDGRQWIIHPADHGTLSRFNENDRVIVGVNTFETSDMPSPFIIIDTANQCYVRVNILNK